MIQDDISCGYIVELLDIHTFAGIDVCRFVDSWYSRSNCGTFEKTSDAVVDVFKHKLKLKQDNALCVLHIITDRWN